MREVIGECGKHPGHNMTNCPLCSIEEQKTILGFEDKFYAVEYSGYWVIQRSPFYGDQDILNAEDVGELAAASNAKLIVELLNSTPERRRE